jgi:dTDP-4-dehydrorhamnose reductase
MENKNIYLVFGKNGWIGKKIIHLLEEQNKIFYLSNCRNYDRENILKEIELYKPTHILNACGVTGRPNVDWCETNKIETLRTNVIGTLNLADICNEKNIHHLLYATGCIFEYDENHKIGGKGFLEEDEPNFHGSFYSHTKALCEDLLKNYTTTCILRIRMPISDELDSRNFITKIVKYDKVVNIPNSMTVISDLLQISLLIAERNLTGIYNFCNPGAISHNECLELYKKYVDSSFVYENFSLEEQSKILVAKRSNNTLDITKLLKEFPEIPDIHSSMEQVMVRIKKNKDSSVDLRKE